MWLLGIQWVDTKDAAKHLQSTGWPPMMKNYLAPNLNSAKDTKPLLWNTRVTKWLLFLFLHSLQSSKTPPMCQIPQEHQKKCGNSRMTKTCSLSSKSLHFPFLYVAGTPAPWNRDICFQKMFAYLCMDVISLAFHFFKFMILHWNPVSWSK